MWNFNVECDTAGFVLIKEVQQTSSLSVTVYCPCIFFMKRRC